MNRFAQFILRAIIGLVLGVFLLAVVCVLTFAYAWWTESTANIPGIIHVEHLVINDAPAFDFVPNFLGMGIAVAAVALLGGLTALIPRKRARLQHVRPEEQRVSP